MSFENLTSGGIDYLQCRYGKSKMMFRGPKKALDKPYVAVLGGTEVYGKFMETPLPAILEKGCTRAVVNFGHPNAGIDAFLGDAAVMGVCNGAETVSIDIPGAHNLSNRYYSVHPRRNDRFLRASTFLQSLYRDVDFAQFHYTRHLLVTLQDASAERFTMVREELQAAWVARMRNLLEQINNCSCLLWMSDRPMTDDVQTDLLARGPLFVTRSMVEEIGDQVECVVEVVATRDEIDAGLQRLVYGPMEEPAAREMLGPVVHESAARKLRGALGVLAT